MSKRYQILFILDDVPAMDDIAIRELARELQYKHGFNGEAYEVKVKEVYTDRKPRPVSM